MTVHRFFWPSLVAFASTALALTLSDYHATAKAAGDVPLLKEICFFTLDAPKDSRLFASISSTTDHRFVLLPSGEAEKWLQATAKEMGCEGLYHPRYLVGSAAGTAERADAAEVSGEAR